MSQSHFTLSFPLKSSPDAKAVAQELPPLMPDLFPAEDAIGTVHYSRFTVLSDRTLLFLADFDVPEIVGVSPSHRATPPVPIQVN